MKTIKMIIGLAFTGLLLVFCNMVVAQNTAADPLSGVDGSKGVYVTPDSKIQDGIGVVFSPPAPDKESLGLGAQGAPLNPNGMPSRVTDKPSIETANVTKLKTPDGGEIEFKVPSELDNEPAFIDTGDPKQDRLNHIKALNDYFGYDEIEDPE